MSRQPSDEMNAESDAGRAVQIPGAIGDVTERGRAEQLRQVLAAIVESSDDAIISKQEPVPDVNDDLTQATEVCRK